jgi:hypothetical protein
MSLKKLGLIFLVLSFIGCNPYLSTVDEYMLASPKVSLGMSKSEVIEILQASQKRLSNTEIKQPDIYKEDGVIIEILYFRSGWQDDGLTTDDEFTPYVFNDDKLVAKGWAILGGPRTQGQAVPQTTIYKTKIVKPTTIIQ